MEGFWGGFRVGPFRAKVGVPVGLLGKCRHGLVGHVVMILVLTLIVTWSSSNCCRNASVLRYAPVALNDDDPLSFGAVRI